MNNSCGKKSTIFNLLGMKDTIIRKYHKQREIRWYVLAFIIAFLLNVFSIIKFGTNWIEVFTEMHIVFAVSLLLYLMFSIIRILGWIVLKLFDK